MTTTTTTRTTTTTTTTRTRTRTRTRRRTGSNNNNDDNNDNDDDDNDDADNEDAARSMSCPQVQMKSPSLFPSPDPLQASPVCEALQYVCVWHVCVCGRCGRCVCVCILSCIPLLLVWSSTWLFQPRGSSPSLAHLRASVSCPPCSCPTYPGGAPIKRDTACCSMYSDMSKRTMPQVESVQSSESSDYNDFTWFPASSYPGKGLSSFIHAHLHPFMSVNIHWFNEC